MNKTILLIGALDTKGEEFAFVKQIIENNGFNTLLLDTGILGEPIVSPDISSDDVAKAGGETLKRLRKRGDRGFAVDVMIHGVRKLIPELYEKGQFAGVLSLGGGAGTNIATAGMRELPVGVPKLMVSTLASSDVSPFVDIKDITMMYSVVDIAGLNKLSKTILSNAAGAICGMVSQSVSESAYRPLIAATMFGVTTPYVTTVREILEKAGYETAIFHAAGSGGRAMEGLIRDGYFAAVADLTTTEWCDEVAGGVLSAGPHRLEAAAKAGIPQVVSVGALDMVNFHAMSTVPEKFRNRKLYKHNPTVTLMRTTPEECAEIGKRISEKLNMSAAPVVLMLPLKGVSALDREGQPFHDPAAREALFNSLNNYCGKNVTINEMDFHINDPEFGVATANELLTLLGGSGTGNVEEIRK